MKMPLHRHLKGLGTLRNQQVACSSRVTSFQKIPVNGLFAGILCIQMWAVLESRPTPRPTSGNNLKRSEIPIPFAACDKPLLLPS